MGTNYYWISDSDLDSPVVHIGKKSAAGLYCRSCGITSRGHTAYIHDNRRNDPTEQCIIDAIRINAPVCPNCGEPWELTSSFTFTMMWHLDKLADVFMSDQLLNKRDRKPVIIDEYNTPYTASDFLNIITTQCPIIFQHYGRWS